MTFIRPRGTCILACFKGSAHRERMKVSGAGFHPAADFQSAFLTHAPFSWLATTFESAPKPNTGKIAGATAFSRLTYICLMAFSARRTLALGFTTCWS